MRFMSGSVQRLVLRVQWTGVLSLVAFLLLCSTKPVLAGEVLCPDRWYGLQTRHTQLCFQNREDLKSFASSVKYGPGKWNRSSFFGSLSQSDYEQMLVPKIDALFARVQEILDMRKKMERVRIEVYADKASLSKAYSRFYRGECRIRAWYNVHNNTVYLNVNDVHAGMVAHELAHAIIDHYLLVRPPRQTAEILARYVDSHLE